MEKIEYKFNGLTFIIEIEIELERNRIRINMDSRDMLTLCFYFSLGVLEDISTKLKILYEMKRKEQKKGKEFKQIPRNMAKEIYVHMYVFIETKSTLLEKFPALKKINRSSKIADIGADFSVDDNSIWTHSAYYFLKANEFLQTDLSYTSIIHNIMRNNRITNIPDNKNIKYRMKNGSNKIEIL
ncbi:hypothetical protein [Leptotrichia massiliensis]|uniref:hypothetical protein n=1 Tax=Leptotrichia massiliensis TaxID=1852388 RepID=UPI0008D9BFDA|nr:hypothetical protein [Leptotrichia massiliensis]